MVADWSANTIDPELVALARYLLIWPRLVRFLFADAQCSPDTCWLTKDVFDSSFEALQLVIPATVLMLAGTFSPIVDCLLASAPFRDYRLVATGA